MGIRNDIERRAFLRWTAAAAATVPLVGRARLAYAAADDGAVEVAFVPESVPENKGLFPNAVLAGDMKPTSALLAGYFADRGAKKLLLWRQSARPGYIALVREMVVDPDPMGYVKTPLAGLQPGTWYRYAYFDNMTARSLIGEFRTALAPDDLEPLTMAISACNGGYYDPASAQSEPFSYPAFEATAQQHYDMFLHLGDQAYMDFVQSRRGPGVFSNFRSLSRPGVR